MSNTRVETVRTGITILIVVGVAAFSLLPIANWIPGGHGAPWYAPLPQVWMGRALRIAGIAIVLAVLSRRVPALWRAGMLDGVVSRWTNARHTDLGISVAALVAYVAISWLVFSARPLLIDEISQMLHAQAYAGGSLGHPTPAHPEFFSSIQFLDLAGRSFSHFPSGGPAMLALGIGLGAAWLIVPLCGAIAVFAFASIVRRIESRPGVRLAAILLFAFAPFMAFMAGTYMNHVPMLMWALVGAAAMLRVVQSPTPAPWPALASGFGFAAAATIRPADALAFALPAAAWYLVLALKDRRRWLDAIAAGAGIAIPLAALLWVNWATTGSPLRFAYETMWGPEVGLGFHASAPWGEPHTPLRGIELVNVYLLRLGSHLYETPLPSLLPALIALALSRQLSHGDRYLLAGGALTIGIYFAYWYSGYYLGPRFMIPLVPVFAIWTARLLPSVRERLGTGMPYRAVTYASIAAVAGAITIAIPARAREYSMYLLQARWDVAAVARDANATDALVFVRERWSTQLLARLWALDVPRSDAERFWRHVDKCVLDTKLATIERDGVRGAAALTLLGPLMRDSARVETLISGAIPNGGRLPGLAYSSSCEARLAEDRGGVMELYPVLLARGDGNVYARDLHARDTLLLAEYPDRPVYMLRPPLRNSGTTLPRFVPLSRDSLWIAWTGHPGPAQATAARD